MATDTLPSPTATTHTFETPPEIEQTLSRLSAYRNVRGVMVLARRTVQASNGNVNGTANGTGGAGPSIIQSSGSVFDGESGRKYARVLEGLVGNVAKGIAECDEGDELKFMRIRTKRHELIITPDERYLLVVLQDPGS